jgi:hypothetical protein
MTADYLKGNGKMIINLEEVLKFTLMEIDMMVSSSMVKLKERVHIIGIMVNFMRDSG